MAQSEEHPKWVQIQNKTFTKWVNSHLAKRGLKVDDMVTGFNDGIRLIQFLEVLSNSNLGKYDQKVRMRIQKIQNIGVALNFLTKSGVRLLNIGPEDICDGNLKLLLGLIWIIIQKFQIDDITEEELTAKEALLLWCKKKTKGYRDCHIENFHMSWQDGMGLCALIHAHRPDLIPYDKLSKNNAVQNVTLAFEVAEKHLGIPQLLEVDDLVNIPKPDERSVMTYIAQFYHVFSSSRKQEVAGRRVGKLVDLASQLQKMRVDFDDRAKQLVVWINLTTARMTDRKTEGTLADIKLKIKELDKYKSDEKPPKAGEKTEIDALFASLQLMLRQNNRPPYQPLAGHSPEEIDGIWEKLANEEHERLEWLRRELARLTGVEGLMKKFDDKAGKLEFWITGKQDYLSTPEEVNSLAEAQTKLKLAEAFGAEYKGSERRLEQVKQLAKDITSLSPNSTDVVARTEKISEAWSALRPQYEAKLADLKKKLANQERIEELRKKFAAAAKEYMRFNKDAIGEAGDHNFGDSLETVEKFRKKLDKNEQDASGGSKQKKDELDQLWAELDQLGATSNPYTVITNKDIQSAHNRLLDELQARRAAYESELQRQKAMEDKKKEFAKAAQDFVDSLEERRNDVDKANKSEDDPHKAIDKVQVTFDDNKPEKHRLDALSNLQTAMLQMGIRDNPHTKWTLPLLKHENVKFGNHVRNTIQALNDEIELKEEYASKAKALADWAKETTPHLKKNFERSLEGARARYDEWNRYKSGESAEKFIDKSNLESLFRQISVLVKNYSRPEFKPIAVLSLEEINVLFQQLSHAEKEAEAEIREELERQEKLFILVRRFNADADDLEAFSNRVEGQFKSLEEIKTLNDARLKAKLLELDREEVDSRKKRLVDLISLAKTIEEHNYNDIASVQKRVSTISGKWETLDVLAGHKWEHIQTALKVEQDKENLRIEFADLARIYRIFIRGAIEELGDRYFGSTIEDVQKYESDISTSDAKFRDKADQHKSNIDAIYAKLQAAGVKDNRHTTTTIEDIVKLRDQLNEAIAKRQQAYKEEVQRSSQNEEKRKEWAKKAEDFVTFINGLKSRLESAEGTPEERIAAINDIYKGGSEIEERIKHLDELAHEMENLGIFSNRHSNLTLNSIKSHQKQFDSSVKNYIVALQEEKAMNERAAGQRVELEKRQKIEALSIQYSQTQQELGVWLENAGDVLTDAINVSSLAEVHKLTEDYQRLAAEIPEQTKLYQSLEQLAGQLKQAGRDSPFSEVTERWTSTLKGLEDRKHKLAEATEVQTHNDSLCKEFAEKAKHFNHLIDEQAKSAANASGDDEAQLKHISAVVATLEGSRGEFEKIAELSNKMDAAFIPSNPYTDLNLKTLTNKYETLISTTQDREQQLQKDIISRRGSKVSADQLAEFKEMFQFFDKNHNNALGKLEFKGALQSLGEDPTDDEMESLMVKLDKDKDGFITFEEFTEFMIQRTADTDSAEQILQSFKEIANDKDFITEEDLRRVMPSQKVDYLVANMPAYSGQTGAYDYKAWVGKAYGR
eukprot:TRINITY_DN2526_c0_g4_i1.p1 TRINITY_DN2526_c0_g4~~TRINITY_DN2526_c0_g4_i1.p1  ORF type:complete len:1557 (-),score=454.20 TRINITY_DN2526_c0_g4_i1:53-4657(-)